MSKDRIPYLKTGALLLLIGFVSTYLSCYRPIRMAENGSASITTSRAIIVLSPLFFLYGLAYIISPKFVEQHLGGIPKEKPSSPSSIIGWLFSIIAIAIGIGLMVWVQALLNQLGYKF
ncbi:MAG: hypothetical protein IPP66_17660 [Anaerolineales bacterium]|nr:hypothetical protein [Anaerolineales bacterium]